MSKPLAFDDASRDKWYTVRKTLRFEPPLPDFEQFSNVVVGVALGHTVHLWRHLMAAEEIVRQSRLVANSPDIDDPNIDTLGVVVGVFEETGRWLNEGNFLRDVIKGLSEAGLIDPRTAGMARVK